MKKRGKIKFSHVKNNRGQKTEYFRLVTDTKDPQGDWKCHPSFPEQMMEMRFRFPFTKMENNIIIGYSGYTKLPVSSQRGAPTASYFVLADGIGEPMVAFPDGHNGVEWDGRKKKDLILTEERLANMKMVKKRMTMIMIPDGWGPHEYVTWSTTSNVAMDYAISDYTSLVEMTGGDLALFPLTFRAMGKTLKRRDGETAKFSIGTIGFGGSLTDFAASIKEAKVLKAAINIAKLEDTFEREGIFYKSADGNEFDDEPVDHDEVTGEVPQSTLPKEEIGSQLKGLLSNAQRERIINLAIRFGREEELIKVTKSASALRLLNQLVTQEARNTDNNNSTDQAAS